MNKFGQVLMSIDPKFKDILKDLINKDSLNLKTHDEGNYDVDRLDYLLRDSLYNGDQIEDYYHEQYTRRYAKTDENGNIMKNDDGSIILVEPEDKNSLKKRIDIYENSSLKVIERFLETRVQAYRKMYFSESIQVRDSSVGIFVNDVLDYSCEDVATQLKDFIHKLKQQDTQIDLNEYLKWDDIKFYTNCFDIAENSSNELLRDFSGMIIPNLKSLMYLTFSHLDLFKSKKDNFKTLSECDKEFIKKIKELISSDSDLSKMLKDKDYFDKNHLISFGKENIDQLKAKYGDTLSYSTATVYGYNFKIPIYIKDETGNVFALHEHPQRSQDWKNRKEEIDVVFVLIPELKLKGVSDEKIEEIRKDFMIRKPIMGQQEENSRKTNMRPIKVDSSMEDYFEI